jgi:hypothetical protein
MNSNPTVKDPRIARAIERKAGHLVCSRQGQHLLDLPFGIGTALHGIDEHVQGEQGREKRAVKCVGEEKVMNENQAVGLQGRDSFFYDQERVSWSHAVKDVRKPDHIIGTADVVLQIVPGQKTYAT